jgi:PAS domain S-box-containing protein
MTDGHTRADRGVDRATLVEAMADPVVVYDGDRVEYANEAFTELTGYGWEDLRDRPASELLHPGDRERLREYQYRRYDAPEDVGPPTRFEARLLTREGAVRTCEFRVRVVSIDRGTATLAVLRDVTDRAERERALERRREELASLADLNDLLSGVLREIVRSPERASVWRILCRRFADPGRYRCAWIEDLDREVRAASGVDPERIDDRRENETVVGGPEGPGARAARDVEVRTERGISLPAEDRTEGTLGAVPLGGGEVVHGVLLAYAGRLDAFDADARAALAVFGETVGFALTAIENRELLLADAATEFVVNLGGGDTVVERVATLCGGVELHGYVADGSGRMLMYLHVEEPEISALSDVDAVETAHAVSETAEGDRRLVAVTAGGTFVRTVLEHGGRVVSARSAADGVRFTVAVAGSTPTRAVLRRITEAYPTASVVSKRERDARVREKAQLRDAIRDRLTDHQWRALRAAYLAGYFEWPRDCTGATVAESLGVSAPTLHYHLRNAHRRVLNVVFDGTTTVAAGVDPE